MNSTWQRTLRESIVTAEELAGKLNLDPVAVRSVTESYPLRITRNYLDLINAEGDPVWRQCIPDQLELAESCDDPDPLDENSLSPVPGLIHRYPDRVVWLVSNNCAVFCRFCMRKRRIGHDRENIPASAFADAVNYLQSSPAIRDVTLSGGDPLLLDDDRLAHILASLRSIPHIEIIRIGTRTPVTLPERITPALCSLLKKYHPVYINTHFNHPVELTQGSSAACAMLADSGIPLGNQTVLLKGVNDDPVVMATLFRRLLSMRVKPYYLHQMDLVRGTAHFRTTVDKGFEIMSALRGHVSGMAVPYYVVDLPGGKGKVPVLPGMQRGADGAFRLTTYTGEEVSYREL